MKWHSEHTTGGVLLLALSLPVFTVYAALHTAGDRDSSQRRLFSTQAVLLDLQQVQLDVSAAGAAQRAYLLHGQAASLDVFHQQQALANSALAQLALDTAANPLQRPLLQAVDDAVTARFDFFDRVLALRGKGNTDAARTLADSQTGLASAGDLRARAQAVANEETRYVALRRRNTTALARRWRLLFWGACLACLVLIAGCFGMLIREVRARRRTQQALVFSHEQLDESWKRYDSLIANVPAAVWTMRRDGTTEFISSRIEDLTGYPAAAVRQSGPEFWQERIHPQDQEAARAAFAQLFETGTALSAEYRVRHRNGAWVWLQAQGQTVYRRDGGELADGVFSDISERKRLAAVEMEHREAAIRLEEAAQSNRLKGEFLASVSHEFRTPLSAILGFSDLLLQGVGGDLNREQREFADHIHRSGNHLLELINDILDLTKLEAGQMQFRPEPLPLRSVAVEALATLEPLMKAQGLRVACDVDPDLRVIADPLRIRQVLINLLSNAVKFTPRGGRVQVVAQVSGARAVVTVQDSGMGIAREHLRAIFDRFRQVGETVHGVRQGTGLGLAITRQLVMMHGGAIDVESEIGRGSCFRFDLPLAIGGGETAQTAAVGAT